MARCAGFATIVGLRTDIEGPTPRGVHGCLALAIVVATAATAHAQPEGMKVCGDCHPDVYEAYIRHGMAESLGPIETPPRGGIANPRTGQNYRFVTRGDRTVLEATARDGGVRRQQVVGRIGAGILDTSWATVELDPVSGRPVNRLFFAPVETVTGHGLELAPFEHSARPAGLNMPLTEDCLDCHTDSRIGSLPGASADEGRVFPAHALGPSAFRHLQPLTCDACHGDTSSHVRQMNEGDESGPALRSLSKLSPAQQRDVCARCHLQGDVRLRLADGRPAVDRPLAAQVPVLVASSPPGDDFRFVGQVERLALSECFRRSQAMTCTTCHDPHRGVRDQGLPRLEAACLGCHVTDKDRGTARHRACGRPDALKTGTRPKARSPRGCIDCHLRRSQPFDLPGVRSTDHFIRRRIPEPRAVPFRAVSAVGRPLRLWDDDRLRAALKTKEGRRWRDGVLAMGWMQVGQPERAAALFARFPPPGHRDAVRATAPAPLRPVERWPTFHQLRAMSLLAQGQPREARAAFNDALRIDPGHPGALMGRARLALLEGDLRRVVSDTQVIIDAFPAAEQPWHLRFMTARRLGNVAFQIKGLRALVQRWPSDPRPWLQLAELYGRAGDSKQADAARQRAASLAPSLVLGGR